MRRALITGAAGRLGRHVVASFSAEGISVVALVREGEQPPAADTVVVGDARDVVTVRKALDDVDVVVHLAALPSPHAGTATEVFCNNTAATYTVLEEAASAGVRRAVIASSHAISGRPFGPQPPPPAYLPIDESAPTHIADPSALSNATDEATAAMMWRRHGMSVCALRFPFLGEADGALRERGRQVRADPSLGVCDLWAYLDLRDAARACLVAAKSPDEGFHVVQVAAPRTFVPCPTEELLDRFLPEVPRRRRFVENEVPLDLSNSQLLLGFSAQHVWTS
jgi:nucleoside-diphosphate-sugar epimerase